MIITILISVAIFFIVYGVRQAHLGSSSNWSESLAIFISFLIALFVIVLGKIATSFIRVFTRFEKRTYVATNETSSVIKLSLFLFANTTLTILVTGYFRNNSNWVESFWRRGGTVNIVVTTLVLGTFFQSLFVFVSPEWIKALYARWKYERSLKGPAVYHIFQCDLNRAYEHMDFGLAGKYVTVIGILTFSLFYQFIFPYAQLFGVLNLLAFLCVSRYALSRHTAKGHELRLSYTFYVLLLYDYTLLIFSIGQIIFQSVLFGHTGWFIAVALCFAAANFAASFALRRKITDYNLPPDLRYSEEYYKLSSNFDRENPLTRVKARAAWLRRQSAESLTALPTNEQFLNSFFDYADTKSFVITPTTVGNVMDSEIEALHLQKGDRTLEKPPKKNSVISVEEDINANRENAIEKGASYTRVVF